MDCGHTSSRRPSPQQSRAEQAAERKVTGQLVHPHPHPGSWFTLRLDLCCPCSLIATACSQAINLVGDYSPSAQGLLVYQA